MNTTSPKPARRPIALDRDAKLKRMNGPGGSRFHDACVDLVTQEMDILLNRPAPKGSFLAFHWN